MASASTNKVFTVRASAVTTNAEVAGSTFTVNNAASSELNVHVSFTLGMLTNGIFRWYVSKDGSTWVPMSDFAGNISYTLTASTEKVYNFDCKGWRFFRVSVEGTGTVTNSLAAVTVQHLRRGAV
jgi:hypothetical protein